MVTESTRICVDRPAVDLTASDAEPTMVLGRRPRGLGDEGARRAGLVQAKVRTEWPWPKSPPGRSFPVPRATDRPGPLLEALWGLSIQQGDEDIARDR